MEQTAAPQNGRRRLMYPVAIVIAAALAYFFYWLIVARGTVYTDDAQTQGLIVPCGSRVGGRVVEVLAWEGQKVKKGDLLARLDEMPYKAQLEEARAAVAAAEALLDSARLNLRKVMKATDKEVTMAEADLRAARAREAFARREKSRFSRVQDVVSGEAVEQVATAWSGTDAALTAARQRLSMLTPSDGDSASPRQLEIKALENQVATAQAQVDLARARLSLAENNFAEITVTALCDGWISRRHVDPGQVVSPGQKLFSLTSSEAPWIEANFEEGDIGDIAPGDRVTVEIDAFPGRSFTGVVDGILRASLSRFSLLPSGASSGNFIKVTQRVPVRIKLEGELSGVFPGLNAEVRVHVGSHPSAPVTAAAGASSTVH